MRTDLVAGAVGATPLHVGPAAFPAGRDATWPGQVPYFALSVS